MYVAACSASRISTHVNVSSTSNLAHKSMICEYPRGRHPMMFSAFGSFNVVGTAL